MFYGILFSFIVAAGRKAFQENMRKKKGLAQFPEDVCKSKGIKKKRKEKIQVRELNKGGAGAGRAGIKFP